MLSTEIRARVLEGLATGRLWRVTRDLAAPHDPTGGSARCNVCHETIPRGQVFGLARGPVRVLVHLECYMFWLHASGVLEREPVTCAACERLIPPHADTTVFRGLSFHERCWERRPREMQPA
jgi:hypothetical protein